MMSEGVTVSRQLEEKEIIMAVVTHPNVSSTLKAVGGRVMLVKQLHTIKLPLAVVSPATTIVKEGELVIGTSLRAIIHATARNSHHENQGAVAEVVHLSNVVPIQE